MKKTFKVIIFSILSFNFFNVVVASDCYDLKEMCLSSCEETASVDRQEIVNEGARTLGKAIAGNLSDNETLIAQARSENMDQLMSNDRRFNNITKKSNQCEYECEKEAMACNRNNQSYRYDRGANFN